jgi:hypothetical protein
MRLVIGEVEERKHHVKHVEEVDACVLCRALPVLALCMYMQTVLHLGARHSVVGA